MLKYFAGGNTAKGFYSLYETNLRDLHQVFILSGRSTREKTAIIKKIFQKWSSKYELEIIHSAFHEDELDGVIIRELGIAIMDGDPPRNFGKVSTENWETIDLDQSDRIAHLDQELEIMNELKEKMNERYELAYDSYAAGLRVHDDWEDIYIKKMDFTKANQVTDDLISILYKDGNNDRNKPSSEVHRFLGAATPSGPVDYVNQITEGLSARYFLKGRAGTGKSTVLKKVVAEAKNHGYDLEIYHCGFDPNSLDMVVVRSLGWAVFDSTKPHEYFPTLPGDEVIDMYELTVAPGTDEMFAEEIAKIESEYRKHMDDGKKYLLEAKKYRDQLEELYAKVTDESHLDQIFTMLDDEIQFAANS